MRKTIKVSPLVGQTFICRKDTPISFLHALNDVVISSLSLYALSEGMVTAKLKGNKELNSTFEGKTQMIDFNNPLYVSENSDVSLESSVDCFARVVMFKPSNLEKEIYK